MGGGMGGQWRGFELAERRALQHYDLEASVHVFASTSSRLPVRVLDIGRGASLVLLASGGGVACAFAPLIAQLAGRRLLAIDNPSLPLPLVDAGGALRRHAVAFLDAVWDHLGLGSVDLAGSSMGGTWAIWFALDRPDNVRSVIQLGCPALLLDSALPSATTRLTARSAAGVRRFVPADAFHTATPTSAPGLSSGLSEVIARGRSLPGRRTAQLNLLRHVLAAREADPDFRVSEDELMRLRQPTLLIWGSHDPLGPPDIGARACAAIPDCRLEVVDGGHMPWLDSPRRSARAMKAFLDERVLA